MSNVTDLKQKLKKQIEDAEATTGITVKRPSFGVYEEERLIDGEKLRAGVWFHTVDKKGDPSNRYVCSPLIVEAVTSNNGNDFGRLVRFVDTFGEWRKWALPMAMLKGDGEELRGEFLSRGAYIDPDARRHFNRYLMVNTPSRRMVAATDTGWHSDKLFIMPRQNIGEGDAIYQSEAYHSDDYGEGGTLEEWKATIGTWCEGNPLLMLAVCTALAGPLLKHLGHKGAGFHMEGDSSTGKTTALNAGASVWGKPEKYVGTWRSTSNGMEGIASQRNDTALVLDEIGQATGNEVGDIVYMLANGVNKIRGRRKGGSREVKNWRLMVLSSGELSLERHMQEGGKRSLAGQEVRLLSVSAHRSHGAWDNLHHFNNGRELSDAIQKATSKHYGHVGPAFIKALIESGEVNKLQTMLEEMTPCFDDAGRQVGRAAGHFAIAALAGELAITFGLLPIPNGSPTRDMVALFNAWKEKRGSGQSEDSKILQSVSEFLDLHGDSRFSDIDSPNAPTVYNRAGWWKHSNDGRTYMLTNTGLKEAAQGYDIVRITEALNKAGWIVERGKKERAKQVKVNGSPKWLYHIREVQS